MSKDEQIKKEARINVTAYQGKVLLVGQSPNAELSARAKQIAMGVEGANEVYNEIRQGQPIGLGEASNDTWITTKVRSQLLTSDLVKSSNVKVTTENGEVFLMGLVTEREAKAAADIASRVSGVIQTMMLAGMGTAPALALLMTLPAVSLPSLIMLRKAFPTKALWLTGAMVAVSGVIVGGLALLV